MGLDMRETQGNGGFSRTEIVRAREEDARRIRGEPTPVGVPLVWDGERYRAVPKPPEERVIHGAVIEVMRCLDEERDERERIAREGRL